MGPRNDAPPPVHWSKEAIIAADARMNVTLKCTIIVHGDGTQRLTILVIQRWSGVA